MELYELLLGLTSASGSGPDPDATTQLFPTLLGSVAADLEELDQIMEVAMELGFTSASGSGPDRNATAASLSLSPRWFHSIPTSGVTDGDEFHSRRKGPETKIGRGI
ncbi:hypothetical protein L484_002904 [Morus notabilis]|uniref:Uncharacterized protein n=1 Tax=Morus notabilis TaxID=981085 RepID=W9QWE4_9ROSA|nr:hypothetical protein L484_002904 [Morus notabilis]